MALCGSADLSLALILLHNGHLRALRGVVRSGYNRSAAFVPPATEHFGKKKKKQLLGAHLYTLVSLCLKGCVGFRKKGSVRMRAVCLWMRVFHVILLALSAAQMFSLFKACECFRGLFWT